MMPEVDFARLLNDTDHRNDLDLHVASNDLDPILYDLDLKPSANSFHFTYTKQESMLNDMYMNRNLDYEDKTVESEDSDTLMNLQGVIYPVFMTVFLILDLCLLIYRFSWMVKSIHSFKNGLENRVPCNSITRKIHFILTGKDIPKLDTNWEDPYDQFKMLSQKKNFWSDRKTYFLYWQSTPKKREEILNEIMAKERLANPRLDQSAENKNCCRTYAIRILKFFYSVFISAVFWRVVLLLGFLLILCLVAKATNDLVTMESAMFLLDTEAMVPILERQGAISADVVAGYGVYLRDFASEYKQHLDNEVQLINNILVSVAERQVFYMFCLWP